MYNDKETHINEDIIEAAYKIMEILYNPEALTWLERNYETIEDYFRLKEIALKIILMREDFLLYSQLIIRILETEHMVSKLYSAYRDYEDKVTSFKNDIKFAENANDDDDDIRQGLLDILKCIIDSREFPQLEKDREIQEFIKRDGRLLLEEEEEEDEEEENIWIEEEEEESLFSDELSASYSFSDN